MWKFRVIKEVAKMGCALLEGEDEERKKERVVNLVMDLWEEIDPTPNLDIDDWIVRMTVERLVGWIVEDMNGYTESLSLS